MLGQRLFNVAAPFSMLLNRFLPVMSVVSETCVTVLAVVRLLFKTHNYLTVACVGNTICWST